MLVKHGEIESMVFAVFPLTLGLGLGAGCTNPLDVAPLPPPAVLSVRADSLVITLDQISQLRLESARGRRSGAANHEE